MMTLYSSYCIAIVTRHKCDSTLGILQVMRRKNLRTRRNLASVCFLCRVLFKLHYYIYSAICINL